MTRSMIVLCSGNEKFAEARPSGPREEADQHDEVDGEAGERA